MQLIYYVCYGVSQRNILKISVESLRRAANYRGRIFVFTDEYFRVPGADQTHIVPPAKNWTEQSIGRVDLGLQIEGDFSEIAYLDNDILATRPLDAFFSETHCFRAMEEESVWMGSHHSSNCALTLEERALASQRRPIISGAIVASGSIFKDCLLEWKNAFSLAPDHHFREQSALNAAVLRGWIPFKAFNYDVIAPANSKHDINRQACLLHFWANEKSHMPYAWREWNRRKSKEAR